MLLGLLQPCLLLLLSSIKAALSLLLFLTRRRDLSEAPPPGTLPSLPFLSEMLMIPGGIPPPTRADPGSGSSTPTTSLWRHQTAKNKKTSQPRVCPPARRFPGSKRVKSLHSSAASAKPPEGNAAAQRSAGNDRLSDVIWNHLRGDSDPQSARICLLAPPPPPAALPL